MRRDSSRAPGTLFFFLFLDYTNTYLPKQRCNHCLGPRARDASTLSSPGIFFTHTLQHGHDNMATSPHQQPTRKGPNDARCIVWALCKFFLKYSFIFYMLIGIYRYYIDYNDDIWFKRRDTRCLGSLVSVFLKLTTIVQSFLNVPKQQDPNNGVTVVWAPVLFYYTKPRTRPPQLATSPHQATSSMQQGMYEGSRRTGSSTSTSSL